LDKLKQLPSFVATVVSKRMVYDSDFHADVNMTNSRVTAFVVELFGEDGRSSCLAEIEPRPEHIQFVRYLIEGKRYRFPDALSEWEQTH
jgi:hypothetical protein